MAKIIISITALLIAALVTYVATRPSHFRIERTQLIRAPVSKIFGLVNDFHQWELWSPWEQLDKDVNRKHGRAINGEGATFEWRNNAETDSGRMQIVSSIPTRKIVVIVDATKPTHHQFTVEMDFMPQGDTTLITGIMYGKNNFSAKLRSIIFDTEHTLGAKFEEGLTNLKILAET